MNYARVVLAAVGGMVAYFIAGAAIFGLAPQMANEFQKYSGVYRSREGQMAAMPAGMAAMLIAICVLAVLYEMLYQGGSGVAEGARFGALIGVERGEAFFVREALNVDDPVALLTRPMNMYS